MNKKNVEMIQGQQVEVIQLNLSADGYVANLSLKFSLNNNIFCMYFHRVSNLKIKGLSMPMQIGGFEILDNKDIGWDTPSRYTVHDFEEGIIEFFCEYFEFEPNNYI